MAEYGELKNLQAFLAYWNFTADKFEQQNDIYGRLTGAIIRDWVYDYTKEGDFLVENGDLDWLVKGSASDDQKLAAFDQWLGHNTANPAIVPAIQDYLVEHRQEINQEVKDHQLTLDNVTDDSAERYMEVLEKINDQKTPSQELMLGWQLCEERTQEIIYHDEQVEAVKKLTLTDDASDRGGKAYADETAGDFMQTAFGSRADVDFKELNQALKESGIKPLAEPLAQQKIERAAKVLAKNYAQDQTSMAVAEYLQNTKRPMAQRLKVANNIIAARRPHSKIISNSKKQTKER